MGNTLCLARIHNDKAFDLRKLRLSGRNKTIEPAQGVLVELLESFFLGAGENEHGPRIQQGCSDQRGQSIEICILVTGNGGDFHARPLFGPEQSPKKSEEEPGTFSATSVSKSADVTLPDSELRG